MAKAMIQAVTVSVNYADFLAETLPYLMKAVSRVVVVTSLDDRDTYDVATANGAHCVRTNAFTKGGAKFRKGLAINEGLQALGDSAKSSWLLHVDADIAIFDPIPTENLHRRHLYGCERYCVIGRQAWDDLRTQAKRDMPLAVQDNPHLKPGRRFGRRGNRILPPGFFQLWHGMTKQDYPSESKDASMDDMTHAQAFRECHVLDGYKVFHLESEDHSLRLNWRGRVSSKF